MDDAVQRFRRQAGRELGDRQGAERRYSDGLRQQAVAYDHRTLSIQVIHLGSD
jgi:hypothetical protein